MQSNKVSIIIPVYNRCDTLKSAIESVMAQTYKNYEIIVIDDGSQTCVVSISDILRAYEPLIRLVKLPVNMGVSAARNCGLRASTGKYVAFLDSDDLWLASKLEKQLNIMLQENAVISHTNEYWYRQDKFINNSDIRHKKYSGNFQELLDKCRVSPSSFMIRRDIYENNKFNENLRTCEDYDFFIRLGAQYPFCYLNEKLVIKRDIEENSLSRSIQHIESIRLSILENLCKSSLFTDSQLKMVNEEIMRKNGIVKKD